MARNEYAACAKADHGEYHEAALRLAAQYEREQNTRTLRARLRTRTEQWTPNVCWWLNRIGAGRLVASERRRIHQRMLDQAHYHTYSDRDAVGGWSGYVTVPWFGVIGYIPAWDAKLDGPLPKDGPLHTYRYPSYEDVQYDW